MFTAKRLNRKEVHIMYANNLTAVHEDKLSAFTAALYERVNKQNEDERLYADLSGLYCDIIWELSKSNGAKAKIIFDYASLLCQEILLHCGEDAYILGRGNKSISADEVFVGYLLKIADKKNPIDSQIQSIYAEIQSLLGDSKGLVSEFTDIFQSVHGVTKIHLRDFISLGQAETEGVA